MPRRHQLLALLLITLPLATTSRAQSPDAVASVKVALLEDVTSLLRSRVLPVMREWREQFDATLSPRDRTHIQQLRERHDMLMENLRNNITARTSAMEKQELAGLLALRPLLERNFQERQRLLSEATRLAERNKEAFALLSARIDSTAEEWRAAAMRVFVDWFTQHRQVVTEAMNGPLKDELASIMLACKNIGLDEMPEYARAAFVLWDGEDFTTGIRERGVPVTPLTNCRLERGDVILLEDAWPNPFRDETRIRFLLPEPGLTMVRLLDGRGREIRRLHGDPLPVGKHMVTLRADGLDAGTYYVVLENGRLFDVISVRLARRP